MWEIAAIVCLGCLCAVSTAAALYYRASARRSRPAFEVAAAAETLDPAPPDWLEREFDALMDKFSEGVLLLDDRGVILRANRPACRIFGLFSADFVGRRLTDTVRSKELGRLVVHSRERDRRELREIHLNIGTTLIISVSPIPIDGAPATRYLLVAEDVTELRRLETVRRDFVANVSHELRTPLASIRAMAETLQDGALKDVAVADRFLGTIIGEAQRLTRISEDLLILSHAESKSPERAPFNLSALISEAVGRLQPQARQSQIDISVAVPPGIEVMGNRDQIEQVIVNLVDNAIKYSSGAGAVRIIADLHADGAAVHVKDNGIGILKEDLPRIFERFYRVDKARSRRSGGTGLGLSIVKHIVESHGGQVMVESEYNHGSTFSFTLPTAPPPE